RLLFLLFLLIRHADSISFARQIEMIVNRDLGNWVQYVAIGYLILMVTWLGGFLAIWTRWARLTGDYQNQVILLGPQMKSVPDKILLFDDNQMMKKVKEDRYASDREFNKKMKKASPPPMDTTAAEQWKKVIQRIREEKSDVNMKTRDKMEKLRALFRQSVQDQLITVN
ncbi:hypothetical protein PFISCL1PPCAC_23580, partial [Pristionchus fissidentatus]